MGEKDLGGGEPPLSERGLSPSKPPSLSENFPHVPAAYEVKICFVFKSGGDMGEVFYVWGGMNLLQRAAIALVLWAGSARI